MPFLPTPIDGLLLFEPRLFRDERGYFYESFNQKTFEEAGIPAHFVQDNQAYSTRGVLRGLHYQTGRAAQAKLVRVVQGEVQDVAVDLRPQSPTFGQWYSVVLSAENHRQLYVPRGFAHGYLVLSDTALFLYKCDNFYAREQEGGLRFDDPAIDIHWVLPAEELFLSEKDRQLPTLGHHRPPEID